MADKQERGILQTAVPSEEVVSIAAKRLKMVCNDSKQTEIVKVLNKRRRKWRHKQKLPFQEHQALEPGLRDEKELLSDSLVELKEELLNRRREGLAVAMQLQRERGEHCLKVIQQRLQGFAESFRPLREAGIQPPLPPRVWLAVEEQMTKELHTAIDRCATLAELRQMKHHMTPRLPPLHDRTLSGNYLDASFGLLRENHSEEVVGPTTTAAGGGSEATALHCGASKIVPELAAISSEEMNGYSHFGNLEIVLEDQLPVIAETVERSSGEPCEEEEGEGGTQLDSNPTSEEQHSDVCSNITFDVTAKLDTTAKSPTKSCGAQTAAGEEPDTDSDSQSYSKLLKNIEQAPYELRFRVRNSERLKKKFSQPCYYGPYNN